MNVQSDRRKWAALFVVVLLGSVSVLYAGNDPPVIEVEPGHFVKCALHGKGGR